jgi:maltose alpha-D-glucosyltransferase/alpha-amylase
MTFIRPAIARCCAYVRQYSDEVILCVANLSRSAQATELDLSAWKDRIPLEMLGRSRFPAIGELPYMITLGPYGFYWFQLKERDKSEHVEPTRGAGIRNAGGAARRDLDVAGPHPRRVRARRAAGHLARTRWYPERSAEGDPADGDSAVPFCDIGDNRPWLPFSKRPSAARRSRYVLPMQIEWVRFDRERYNPTPLRRCARARAKERCSTSPPTRSSSRCCCAICGNP